MFFKHFASKNQLPGFCINETLIENGSIKANISYGKNRGKGIFLSGGRGGGGGGGGVLFKNGGNF